MYDPDNFRRKSRDWSAQEGASQAPHDAEVSGMLSVSAAAAASSQPVYSEARAGQSTPAGRRAPERLMLVPQQGLAGAPIAPGGPPAASAVDERERVARVFAALEDHVIPSLVGYHDRFPLVRDAMKPNEAEIEEFFGLLLHDDEAAMLACLTRMRGRGLPLESLYLDLFVPCALRMGDRWRDDRSDFVAVTVAVGRLQHFVRRFSPDFCDEVAPGASGRRVLLAQPDGDTHMFGLSLVAEFFRRDGWDVVGGVGGSGVDPAQRVRSEWFDVAGLSIGSELMLPWIKECIASLRQHSCNRALVVMVGGPVFALQPALVAEVGADLTTDARSATRSVLQIMTARERELSPASRLSRPTH